MLRLPEKFWSEGIFLTTADGFVHWGVGPFRSRSHSEPATSGFFAPEFFLRGRRPWILPEKSGVFHRGDWVARETGSASPPKVRWVPPKFSDFENRFYEIRQEFERGNLLKAVPVVGETARVEADGDWIRRRVDAVLGAPATLLPYGMWTATRGIVGASPELLFSVADENLTTVALAGTAAPSDSPGAGNIFLADPKEGLEHRLVVDDIKARLSEFGRVSPGVRRVLCLPRLWHLQTPIDVVLSPAALGSSALFENLVAALHPTAALGVFPRDYGFRKLARFSFRRRGRFGAPFGFRDRHGATCLVAIRNVQWTRGELVCGSGCGVVDASTVEKEWEELRLKRESVKALLGIL